MDLLVPEADWEVRGSLIKGIDTGKFFGVMEVERISDGRLDEFGADPGTRWIDIVQPEIPEGEYEFSIHYPNFDFTSTTTVNIDCPDFMTGTTRFYDTLVIGESNTVGVFPPNIRFIETSMAGYIPGSDQVIEFAWREQFQNMTYTALEEGVSQFQIIFCDPQDLSLIHI